MSFITDTSTQLNNSTLTSTFTTTYTTNTAPDINFNATSVQPLVELVKA